MATDPQITYIDQLCIDLGLTTRALRNDWISQRLKKEVKFVDSLSVLEASTVIDLMKAEKEGNKSERPDDRG